MNYGKVLKRYLPVVLIALLGLSGCAGRMAAHTMDWQEEVLLHDGRIAIAERHYNLGGYPTLDSTQRSVVNEKTSFTLPGTGQSITWQSDFRDTVPEPNSLNLLLFDVVNGIPYIATYPAGCIAYNKWQRPNPFYISFKYEQGAWKRIPLAEFPTELTKTNVIVGGPVPELLKPHYTVDGVSAANHYLEPKYKSILREAVAKEGNSCIKTDFYGKGGWLSPDWFSDQPSLEACLKFCRHKEIGADICPCETIFLRK